MGWQVTGTTVLRVAISYVSVEQAVRNLAGQVNGSSFDACATAVQAVWEGELQKVVCSARFKA